METRSKSKKEGKGVHPNLLPSDQGVGEGQGGSSQVLPNPSTINDSRNSLVVGGETQNLNHTMPPTNLLSKALFGRRMKYIKENLNLIFTGHDGSEFIFKKVD